jgi:hypothetical protein
MTLMLKAQVQWTAPAPLWTDLAQASDPKKRATFRQPTILRFNTDEFMDEFIDMLENEPQRLVEWTAQPETWRVPMPTPDTVRVRPTFERMLTQQRLMSGQPVPDRRAAAPPESAPPAAGPFKLYQPAHRRFYLISACLVCREPGLPDRVLNTSVQERASFVVRRLIPRPGQTVGSDFVYNLQTCDEYAFVRTSRGTIWQQVPPESPETLVTSEETLPLFGVPYVETDGRRRRVLAGLIPAGKREEYVAANASTRAVTADAAGPADSGVEPRLVLLDAQVTTPWRSLITLKTRTIERLQESRNKMTAEGIDDNVIRALENSEKKKTRDQIRMLSWYVLLDFADYLERYVSDVWDALKDPALVLDETALYDLLTGAVDPASGQSLSDALDAVTDPDTRDLLEAATGYYEPGVNDADWPTAIGFRFANVDNPAATSLEETVDDLEAAVAAALPSTPPARPAEPAIAAHMAVLDNLSQPAWFVIRCVLERPCCKPVPVDVFGAASVPFQIAGFFDPDAPARPIRIPFPIDTTPGGLRKHDKNVALLLSDVLCGQVKRARGLSFGDLVLSVLPWPFHKGLPGADAGPCKDDSGTIGMICSLSIPIITICALILLIIIVMLFDIIFRWVPYLISCLPIPNFSAKE